MAVTRSNEQLRKPSDGLSVQGTSDVANDSSVIGATLTDALNALLAAVGALPFTAKGDILTWDGAALAVLPVGADGLVLKPKASAASGLEWAAESVGIKSYAYVVAASGGDYTKLSTLLAAHPAPVSVFIKDGAYTESAADITIPANTRIQFESKNAILDMGAKTLIVGVASEINGGTIRGTLATADLVSLNGNYARAIDMQFISTAVGNPVAAQWMVNAASAKLGVVARDCKFVFAGDYANEGGITGTPDSVNVDNPYFVTSGSANNTPIIKFVAAANAIINISNVNCSGPAQSVTAVQLDGTLGKITLKNVTGGLGIVNTTMTACVVEACKLQQNVSAGNKFTDCTLAQVTIAASSIVSYFENTTIGSFTYTAAAKAVFTGCKLPAISPGASAVQPQFSNCQITGAANFVCSEASISNCDFESTLTLTGNHNRVTGGFALGAVSLAGNYNSMNGVRVGVLAGGGTTTITTQTGATTNQIIGCMTDAVVDDALGTTTMYTAEDNSVY